jgi:hypothetical protein
MNQGRTAKSDIEYKISKLDMRITQLKEEIICLEKRIKRGKNVKRPEGIYI